MFQCGIVVLLQILLMKLAPGAMTLACVALGRDLFKSRIEAQIKKRASLRTSNKRCHDPSQTTGSTDSPRTPHNLPQFNKVPDHGVAPERQG